MITIGIDLGTSAVKLLAMDGAGNTLKIVSKEYPLYLGKETSGTDASGGTKQGWTEQDPIDWWEKTAEGLREITAGLTGKVDAVSFSGQMHGLVALDENDNVIRRAILWNDQRTQKQCDYLNETVGRETLLANTANTALTGFTLPKILWMKENEPQLYNKICKVMLPKDYLAYKLTGIFATDYSDASGTMLLDVKNKDWSACMLGIAGIEIKNVPKLFASSEPIGRLTAEAAKQTGLPQDTLVVIGGGDQAVGAVGTGTVNDGMCSVSLGTSGVLFFAGDNFAVDRGKSAVHSFCHANGKYHLMGVTLAAAASTKWWVEDILQSGDHNSEQKNIADAALGANGVYFLPYLNGERTPHNDPDGRGAFVGMTLTTTRADLTQAVLEGVAFSLRDIKEIVQKLGLNAKTARIIGGGAKSTLWCKIIANVLQLRVEKINSQEGPALGAAILALVGAGAFKNVSEACESLIGVTEVFEPSAAAVERYNKRYPVYASLYGRLKSYE